MDWPWSNAHPVTKKYGKGKVSISTVNNKFLNIWDLTTKAQSRETFDLIIAGVDIKLMIFIII